ncbi:MAG: hypothetical protein FJX56_09245, partial [Alphaproteobacteria bacterium]|nr:hypothetical protein [Alphaproteobacteria bacterium]
MEQSAIERAAAYFGAARRSGRVVERPPADLAPGSEGEAYAIQAALHRWFAANGEGDQLGHKIGCTTAVQQQYLNIARPCGGGMLRANAFHGGATIPLAELRRPG